MKRRRFFLFSCLITLILAGGEPAGAGTTEIASLVPATTPFFVVVKDPEGFTGRLASFALPGGTPAPDGGGGIGDLLRMIGIDDMPEGVDLKGPALVAMPQFPFPLIALSVTDYDLFLGNLSNQLSPEAPPPPSLLPGIDTVTLTDKPLFSRREGSFALLSPMPLLLSPPAEGSSIAGILSPEEKELLEGSDAFLRIDVGIVLALAEPFLQQALTGLDAGTSGTGNKGPGSGDGEVRDLLRAESDLFLRGLRQVRAVSLGTSLKEEGVSMSTLFLPHAGSSLETLLRRLKPEEHSFLKYFDGNAVMAGAFRFDADAMEGVIKPLMDLVAGSGMYNLTDSDRTEWERMIAAWFDTAGPGSAYYMGPSTRGGAFSSIVISEVRDADRARSLMRDSLELTKKILSLPAGAPAMKVELKEGAEEHRGVAIDRFSFTFALPEDGTEAAEARDVMDVIFGGDSFNVWTASFGHNLVASYYTSSAADIREIIDRLLENRAGGLLDSTPFRQATAGLPVKTTSLAFFSLPRFLAVINDVMAEVNPGAALPSWPISEESLSGIGLSYLSTGGVLKIDSHVPREELENLRLMTDSFRKLEKEREGTDPEKMPEKTTPL